MALGKRGIYLKNLIENKGAEQTCGIIRQALAAKELTSDDFSLRELAEATMGEDWVSKIDREAGQAAGARGGVVLRESDAAGIDSSVFSNITGQIVYNKIMEGYQAPQFVADRISTTVKTAFHDGEKIAGITEPLGEAPDVQEGMPYPEMGMGEDYIETPATRKNGNIVSITKESIAKDRTGVILQQAGRVGERVGMKKEIKVLDVFLGVTNNYKWKGTTYNTFLTSGGWINDKSGLELVDWTSIEDVIIQLSEIVNPFQTDGNEPLPVTIKDLFVMPSKEMTARRIMQATELRHTSNTSVVTIGGNIAPNLGIVSSALAYQRLVRSGVSAANARNYWFAGDFAKYLYYMEVFPLTVTQAMPNSDAEFERDIVVRYKAAERGVAVVADPRKVARRYVA